MEFNPDNRIVQLCMRGMQMEETGNFDDAVNLFCQAWEEATNDFEKFISAWYIARQQPDAPDKLKWFKTALQLALSIDNEAVRPAFPSLYANFAQCYEELGDSDSAKKQHELALAAVSQPSDNGPFYHGTRADLKVGEFLTAGRISNYKSAW